MSNILFIKKKPFYIFEVNNFLDQKLYNGLLNINFPKFVKNMSNDSLINFKNGKFGFHSDSDIYSNLIKTNIYAQNFHNLVFSKKFFYFFYTNLYFQFLLSRKNSFKHLLKLMRPPKIVEDLDKSKLSYYIDFFTKVRIDIQYSFIENGGRIVPHTDSGEKLLSLMLYLPDYENEDSQLREIESSYGTIFWESKKKNFNNMHQEGISEQAFVKNKNNKILYKSKFVGNKLIGFIKNSYSWHSVEPVNVLNNYIRKSININFYF